MQRYFTHCNVFSTRGISYKKCVNATRFRTICRETKTTRKKVFGYFWSWTAEVLLYYSFSFTRTIKGTVQIDLYFTHKSNFVSSGEILTSKIFMPSIATNKPKSTEEYGYMCPRGLDGPPAVTLTKKLIYKKRLLLRCIHHFKSDLINDMVNKDISGTERSSMYSLVSNCM